MNAEEAEDYVGLPYKEGSYGPDSYNCWGLLYTIQTKHFGVKMPMAPIGDSDRCQQMFKDHVRYGEWTELANPEHGAGALLRGGTEPHVGVYLDIDGGGILHALEGVGVVFTTLDQLNPLGFARTKYYRLSNDRNLSSA